MAPVGLGGCRMGAQLGVGGGRGAGYRVEWTGAGHLPACRQRNSKVRGPVALLHTLPILAQRVCRGLPPLLSWGVSTLT